MGKNLPRIHFPKFRGGKIYDRKIEKILSMFAIRFTDIFGYEKLSGASYYWIQAEKGSFQEWFKDWFGEKF